MQAQVANRRVQPRPVTESHALDPNIAIAACDFLCPWPVLDRRFPIHYLEDIVSRIKALLHHEMNSAELFDRIVQHENTGQERQELRGTQVSIPDVEKRQTDAYRRNGFDHGAYDLYRFLNADAASELFKTQSFEMLRLVLLPGERFDHTDPGKAFLQDRHHRPDFLFLEFPLSPHPLAVINDRHHADRKKEQTHDGEFPIQVNQNCEGADNGQRLFDQVTTNTGQGRLRHACIVRDPRDQIPGPFAVEELQRLTQYVRVELAANVCQNAQGHPRHVVTI